MAEKSVREQISEIHEAVFKMRADQEAAKAICQNVHTVIDRRIDGLHKKIAGNGKPGIEENLETQTRRLDRLETRIIAYASIAMILAQMFGPKVMKKIGWDNEEPKIVYVQEAKALNPDTKIAIK